MSNYFFTDTDNVKREISICFSTIFKIFEATGYDLLNPDRTDANGVTLSDKILTEPRVLLKIVYSFCANNETEEEFYAKLSPESYVEMENAFWNSYADFFVRLGREWFAIAIRQSLQARKEGDEAAKKALLDSEKENSSNLSSSPESKTTGSPKPSGKSPDSQTPDSPKKPKTAPKSSAQSTTRTSRAAKTSGARETSTPTKSSKRSAPKKSS